ncbi:MAG: ABC transporter permease subunit [Gemmatimonadales bacterium]|nr:ABC transporter permease subunit [Gemmatimonadales bacterium]
MTAGSRSRPAVLAALALSALAPLALLLVASVGRDWFYPAPWPPSVTLESWWDAFRGGGRMAAALGTSLVLAVSTGLAGAVVGWPIGRALADLRGWPRHLGAAAAFLPVAVPPVSLATGLHLSALTAGVAGTAGGVFLSHLVPAAGYAALYFLGVFTLFDRRVEDEARTLGAGPWTVLWRVTMPMMRRQMGEAFLLGFLVSWAQVATTLVIGGGRVRTLPLEVFAYLQAGQDRYAATGALLLVIPALLMLGTVRLAVERAEATPL